jgi:DNA polymerase I
MGADRSPLIERNCGTLFLLVLSMTVKTLLLVDGSSYLFRAFHALPDLRNKTGDPTGAIYGMVGMLRRLRQDAKLHDHATLGAVVFDAPGKTFRDDIFPEYKSNRSETPSDLVKQIPAIHEITRALGWPLIMISGIEADDVIGTLAVEASKRGIKTRVSTGDKDMAQLVNDDVMLFNTMTRDNGPIEMMDREGVIKKFSVPPERIIDYLSLMGDAVDGVPGVEKVGPKTAAKWIAEYGSLEAVMAHADQVKGVVGENLRKALDWLPTARVLVTIKTDCDLSAHMGDVDSLLLKDEDKPVLREFFAKAGMRTWLNEVERELGVSGGNSAGTGARGETALKLSAPGTQSSMSFEAPASSPSSETLALRPSNPMAAIDGDRHAPTTDTLKPLTGPVEYESVLSEAALARWLAVIDAAPLTAFDTETTSLDEMQAQLVGISLSVEPGKACYIPLAHVYPDAPEQLNRESVLARIKPWLENPDKKKVGQNLKYDWHVLMNQGIHLRGIEHDTMLQSYVIEAHRSHDMGSLATRHLNRKTIAYADVAGKGAGQIRFDQVAVDKATEYSSEDADVTLHLHQTLYPQIEADPKLLRIYREIEMPSSLALQTMERNGIHIDAAELAQQSNDLGKRLLELERKAYEAAGQPFNLNSPKQLGEIMFERLKLPIVKKTATGAPSTDEEVLEKLAEDYPLPKVLLEYRGLAKLKSTYTDKLPHMINPNTGRVHTHYAQAVAVTGRLSSNDPNLQNIPVRTVEGRRVRRAFVAEKGSKIVSCDYSQIELRIMAHISEDASLLSAFANNLDVHRATASEIFGTPVEQIDNEQRRYAKVINFGLIYGMSAFGLAKALGIDREAAKNYIERYFARYPGVDRYMKETRVKAKEQGYVETVFGRRLWLAEINSPNGPRRQAAERAAINAPMQGTAADLVKLAMIQVQDWLEQEKLKSKLVLQVHDELVLEVPDEELELIKREVPQRMGAVAQLKVPLLVEAGAGDNWEEAH